jgi:hypothetical protein
VTRKRIVNWQIRPLLAEYMLHREDNFAPHPLPKISRSFDSCFVPYNSVARADVLRLPASVCLCRRVLHARGALTREAAFSGARPALALSMYLTFVHMYMRFRIVLGLMYWHFSTQ